jgi:uncharacterized YccA/Bax inhibitor family protein
MSNPLLAKERLEKSTGESLSTGGEAITAWDVVSATATLLSLLFGGAIVGWLLVSPTAVRASADGSPDLPSAVVPAALLAFGFALATVFRPGRAALLGTGYAITEGFVVGAVSHAFDAQAGGAVLASIGVTVVVLATMLLLYSKRIIRPTERVRSVVVSATIGLLAFWLVSAVLDGVGLTPGWAFEAGNPLVSIVSAGVAAFWLVLDFDTVEQSVAARAPRHMRWVIATGLVVTVVWIYVEVLRILAELAGDE